MNECLSTRSTLTSLAHIDNDILFTTLLHGIKRISTQNCEATLHLVPKELNTQTTATTFSSDGKYIAFANNSVIRIYYLATKKLIKSIKSDEGEIVALCFDSTSNYLIAGSKSGRVLLYKTTHSTSLCRLHSFLYDKKESLKELSNLNILTSYNSFVACSGDHGNIAVIDIHSQIDKKLIRSRKSVINALCFLNSQSLVSGDVDGTIEIHNLNNEKSNSVITTPLTDIKQIVAIKNSHYVLVSSTRDSLLVIDTKNAKILIPKYLKFEDTIDKIALSEDNTLIVSLTHSKLITHQLATPKDLTKLLAKEQLGEALLLADENIMLKESQEYKKVLKLYEQRVSQAVNALITNNRELADSLTKEFRDIPSKKEEIVSLFRAFEHFARFRALVLEKKYALAYAMSTKYPSLTYTPQYKKMEESWKITFSDAQRQMILGREDIAKAILNEYTTTITKRSLIKFVLNHNREFLEFLKAIEKRNYKKVFSLVDENKLFKQIPTYTALNEEIEKKLLQTQEFIDVGNLKEAESYIESFQAITHLKERINLLKEHSKNMQELQTDYQKDDFKACYRTLDMHSSLNSTELGKLLNKHWAKVVSSAEEYALKGDIKSIKKELGELLFIESRREKSGNLLRVSYHVKIKLLMSKKSYRKAEAVIYSYLDTFGLDKEINIIKERFEKSSAIKLAIEEREIFKIRRDDWVHSKLLTS